MLHAIYSFHRNSETSPKLPFSVPDYKALLYATILEETIMELNILESLNTDLTLKKTMNDMDYLLAKKYNLNRPKQHDELQNIDPQNLSCMKYKINKLGADRKLLMDVMVGTFRDLKTTRQFTTLGNFVHGRIESAKNRKQLEEDTKRNASESRDLQKRLRLQRRHIKSSTLATETKIYNLTVQLEDQEIVDAVRSRYIGNWQNARSSQLRLVIRDKENIPSNEIEFYKTQIENEQTVHMNVENLINDMIEETLKKINDWMDKYDNDLEQIDLKIQLKKHEYQLEKERRIELEEKIELHKNRIEAWIKFTTEREENRLYREKMQKSAITVQAWWRGLLVRKQLGPFRVRKPRHKKKTNW